MLPQGAQGPRTLQDLIALRKKLKIECRVKTNLAVFKAAIEEYLTNPSLSKEEVLDSQI